MNFFQQCDQQGLAGVRIMTLQGAKGLEAHVVCVLGVEEGAMPRADDDSNQLAEAARLFYVSATRAKDELHLFHARTRSGGIVFRNIYKEGKPPDLQPSRFLDYIDKTHKEDKYHHA
jgi:superfamily I DNA/RNA helicase